MIATALALLASEPKSPSATAVIRTHILIMQNVYLDAKVNFERTGSYGCVSRAMKPAQVATTPHHQAAQVAAYQYFCTTASALVHAL